LHPITYSNTAQFAFFANLPQYVKGALSSICGKPIAERTLILLACPWRFILEKNKPKLTKKLKFNEGSPDIALLSRVFLSDTFIKRMIWYFRKLLTELSFEELNQVPQLFKLGKYW
jgi:hypothetical protein